MNRRRQAHRRAEPQRQERGAADVLLRAVALHQAGDYDGAARLYEALLSDPQQRPDALHYLGLVALQRGDFALARRQIAAAIELLPERPQFHCNLGNACKRLGDRAAAELAYRRALALNPAFAEAAFNLGVLLADRGDQPAAIALFRDAVRQRDDFPPAWLALGNSLYHEEDIDAALRCYQRAVELRPNYREACLALAALCNRVGDTGRALALYRQVTELHPDCREAWQGVLMTMNYRWLDPQEVLDTHRRFGELLQRQAPAVAPLGRRRRAGRVRVGVLSPDLRQHAIRFFVRPILRHADHDRVELFAYYSYPEADAKTRELQAFFDHWRDIARLDDAAAASLIAADGIDILIDLAGHTAYSRVPLLAARLAPVQVSMLGYMNTVGLGTIDYRIGDAVATPPDVDGLFVERLVRLAASQWCYEPDPGSPAVGDLPLRWRGHPTLGLFHTPAKMSDAAFRCWGRVMAALPAARLLVVLWGEATRRIFLERCSAVGIAAERIDCRPPLPHGRYLDYYNEVDVALDVFPYSGGTVSCESLWMGVPFVTYAVPLAQGRGGASILMAAGMADLIATSADEYVDRNLALLQDPARLSELRCGLRERLRKSPLMDGVAYAAGFWDTVLRLPPRAAGEGG